MQKIYKGYCGEFRCHAFECGGRIELYTSDTLFVPAPARAAQDTLIFHGVVLYYVTGRAYQHTVED